MLANSLDNLGTCVRLIKASEELVKQVAIQTLKNKWKSLKKLSQWTRSKAKNRSLRYVQVDEPSTLHHHHYPTSHHHSQLLEVLWQHYPPINTHTPPKLATNQTQNALRKLVKRLSEKFDSCRFLNLNSKWNHSQPHTRSYQKKWQKCSVKSQLFYKKKRIPS